MSKFRFIIVSKDENFKMPREKFNFGNSYVCLVSNNAKSLAKVYNQHLNQVRQDDQCKADFIVFMHADVELDAEKLIAHIEECKNKYDVFGLCGTSVLNISQSPLNWWTGSNLNPEAKWGCVTHGELGNQKSFFSADRANVRDHEVACIDGLCIIFGPKAIASQIIFDEQFMFDFYDTDISFQAILKYDLKLGVLVEESLQHYSVGKSILTQDFLKHEMDFRKKWNLDIPENSPIRKIMKNA